MIKRLFKIDKPSQLTIHLWVRQYARSAVRGGDLHFGDTLLCLPAALSVCIFPPVFSINLPLCRCVWAGGVQASGKWTPVVCGAAHLEKSLFCWQIVKRLCLSLLEFRWVVKLFFGFRQQENHLDGRRRQLRLSWLRPVFTYGLEKS